MKRGNTMDIKNNAELEIVTKKNITQSSCSTIDTVTVQG